MARGVVAAAVLLLLAAVVAGAAVDRDGAYPRTAASPRCAAYACRSPLTAISSTEPRYRVRAHADDLAAVEAATADFRRVHGDAASGEISLEVTLPFDISRARRGGQGAALTSARLARGLQAFVSEAALAALRATARHGVSVVETAQVRAGRGGGGGGGALGRASPPPPPRPAPPHSRPYPQLIRSTARGGRSRCGASLEAVLSPRRRSSSSSSVCSRRATARWTRSTRTLPASRPRTRTSPSFSTRATTPRASPLRSAEFMEKRQTAEASTAGRGSSRPCLLCGPCS